MTTTPGQPTITDLVEAAVEAAGKEIRVALPGRITSVSSAGNRVSVKPTVGNAPVIPDVPLMLFAMGSVRFTFPVAAGDQCLLIFADTNIDGWQREGGTKEVTHSDPRTHDITDALAIPLSIVEPARADDISLAFDNATGGPSGATEVRIQPGDVLETPGDGVSPGSAKIAIGGQVNGSYEVPSTGSSTPYSGPVELLDILTELLDLLADAAALISSSSYAFTDGNRDKVAAWRDKLKMIKGSL